MKNLNIILIILIVVAGVGGFAGGVKYQEGKQRSNFKQFSGNQLGARTGNGNRQGFRPVNGEIISSDEESITVKLQDGSSKIVLVSDNTAINKADQASRDELKAGTKVAVFGQENSDGSVTAQSIQLNPILRVPTGGGSQR